MCVCVCVNYYHLHKSRFIKKDKTKSRFIKKDKTIIKAIYHKTCPNTITEMKVCG